MPTDNDHEPWLWLLIFLLCVALAWITDERDIARLNSPTTVGQHR